VAGGARAPGQIEAELRKGAFSGASGTGEDGRGEREQEGVSRGITW